MAQVGVSEAEHLTKQTSEELLRLDQALRKLATLDERKAQVVEQRYFGGFTFSEIAKLLGVAKPTVERDWNFARKWLRCEIYGNEDLKNSEA